jgi:hypothetical protein
MPELEKGVEELIQLVISNVDRKERMKKLKEFVQNDEFSPSVKMSAAMMIERLSSVTIFSKKELELTITGLSLLSDKAKKKDKKEIVQLIERIQIALEAHI